MEGDKKAPSSAELLGGNKKETPRGKKRKHKHTHVEHHEDGSHTVRHMPADGGAEVSYATPDLDGVHDGLEEHVGEPNTDEEAGEPGPQGGAPNAQV